MMHRAALHPFKEWLNKHAILIPFVVLALAVSLAFYLDHENSRADEKARCLAGVGLRQVQRATVQEIYKLNLSFIDPHKHYTKYEQKQIKQFVKRVTAFRARMYKKIKPSTLCVPFVTDDNVRPPRTPGEPPIKQEEISR
jgi:hypothetical protein